MLSEKGISFHNITALIGMRTRNYKKCKPQGEDSRFTTVSLKDLKP